MGLGQYADDAIRANVDGRGGDLQRSGKIYVLLMDLIHYPHDIQLTWHDPGLRKSQLSSMTLSNF